MKKIYLIFIVLLLASDLSAQDIRLCAGIETQYCWHMLSHNIDIDFDDYSYFFSKDTLLGLGVWADIRYLKLSIDYLFYFEGTYSICSEVAGSLSQGDYYNPKGYGYQSLFITLLGRLPIDLWFISLVPELGLAYNIVIFRDVNANGTSDFEETNNLDVNDLFFVAGLGVQFTFSPVVIHLEALFQWNLLPNFYTDPDDIETFEGNIIQLKIGIGYMF